MKYYKCYVNKKDFCYILNNEPNRLVFEAYDRQELILLAYALLEEYKKVKFCKKIKKSLDTSDN